VPGDLPVPLMLHLPTRLVDSMTLTMQRRTVGDLSGYGLPAPEIGVMTRLKTRGGSGVAVVDPPVLAAIRSGAVQVVPAVAGLDQDGVRLTDGTRRLPSGGARPRARRREIGHCAAHRFGHTSPGGEGTGARATWCSTIVVCSVSSSGSPNHSVTVGVVDSTEPSSRSATSAGTSPATGGPGPQVASPVRIPSARYGQVRARRSTSAAVKSGSSARRPRQAHPWVRCPSEHRPQLVAQPVRRVHSAPAVAAGEVPRRW